MKVYCNLPEVLKSNEKSFVHSTLKKRDAISKGLRYRTVLCLHSNLRGRTDLHGHLYEPTKHIYIESKEMYSKS